MTASALPLTAEAQAALTGFLRGIERRAAVFAELACGDSRRGDAAVVAAVHAFCRAAARAPLADWEACFWSLLLDTLQLRRDPGAGHWPAPWTRLAELGPGLRVALLLRLVAQLDDRRAAALLGLAPATQASAVEQALGTRAAPDSPRWQAWVQACRQQLRLLDGERLARLVRMREAALHGRAPRPAPARRVWRKPLLWAGLATCVLAFAATFLRTVPARDPTPEISVTALPPADPPLARFDAETALLTHRDFDQLAAPPAQQSLARDLAFYAWYAAQSSAGAPLPANASPPAATATGDTHASD